MLPSIMHYFNLMKLSTYTQGVTLTHALVMFEFALGEISITSYYICNYSYLSSPPTALGDDPPPDSHITLHPSSGTTRHCYSPLPFATATHHLAVTHLATALR